MSYKDVVDILKRHFKSTHNRLTERGHIRDIRRYCEFNEKLNENFVEQFRMGINDSLIREKVIDMPLAQQEDFEEVIRKAQEVELNRKMIDLSMNDQPAVQAIQRRRNMKLPTFQHSVCTANNDRKCFRCGKADHMANDQACPARDKKCRVCHKLGHFAKSKFCKGVPVVRNVIEEADQSPQISRPKNEDAALYNIKPNSNITIPKCNANIEGVTVEFIVDTSDCDNVVSAATCHRIARNVELLPTDKQLYGYGTESKLNLLGYFKANISVNGKIIASKFYVFNGSARCLMSYKTACGLESNCPAPVNFVMRITEAHADCVAKSELFLLL
ncbi:hypothetical protein EB796_024348 [Bugula neritina]|uniref:CCHC-type domain-containing protein n=1 Tax=Bugula neritina TaxID=10212 RepID=A0A7J7IU54_BUGNE|nr:hypothetical protein EB796_024348 [Bugula neritina]